MRSYIDGEVQAIQLTMAADVLPHAR